MPSLKILVSSPHSPFQRKKFAIEKAATNLFQGVVATPIFLQNVRRHDFSKHRNRKEAGTEGPRTCLILFRNNHYNAMSVKLTPTFCSKPEASFLYHRF